MSEFKFACPVCGQHITAAEGTSGTQIECPTCFQKIVVPQERSADSKLILNAAMAERPKRPTQIALQETHAVPASRSHGWIFALAALLVLGGLGAAIFILIQKGGTQATGETQPPGGTITQQAQTPPPPPSPAENKLWTMDPAKADIPNEPVRGMLHGQTFDLNRSTLQGGTLSLRQGKSWPPELSIAIIFPAKHGEDLAEKKVLVTPDQPGPLPKVVLRWKTGETNSQSRSFTSGYLLRLNFGKPENQKMPGEVYIALPDNEKSAIAGSFVAEIRQPDAGKNKRPKQPAKPATTPAS